MNIFVLAGRTSSGTYSHRDREMPVAAQENPAGSGKAATGEKLSGFFFFGLFIWGWGDQKLAILDEDMYTYKIKA